MGEERHHGFDETELINLLNQHKNRKRQFDYMEREEKKEKCGTKSYNRKKGFEFEREM